jgi:predicted NBD/HSP70 family sugar kinase
MRSINRSAVLEIIRRESPIARSMIAERLNISLATVMRIIDELIDEELVRPQGTKEWTGGRRRALLEFNPDGQVVIGVDMGNVTMFGGIADLSGNILDEATLSRVGTTGEATLDCLIALIDQLLASPKMAGRKLRGIAVGVPGVTIHKEGVIVWAPSMEWRNFPLKARLGEKFPYPITVDNDVNLSALGELWFGVGQNSQNMVLITLGAGIGAGIVIDGALYRGSRETSGEIGYLLPGREFLGRRYDRFGALEEIASGTGIAQRAREALRGSRSAIELEALQAEDVFEAARQGEGWAREIIADVVDYLAIAIASISTYFDPDVIILSGGVSHSSDLLVAPILSRIEGAIPTAPRLVVSNLDRRAAVMGAITNVLHNTSDFFVVRKLS